MISTCPTFTPIALRGRIHGQMYGGELYGMVVSLKSHSLAFIEGSNHISKCFSFQRQTESDKLLHRRRYVCITGVRDSLDNYRHVY